MACLDLLAYRIFLPTEFADTSAWEGRAHGKESKNLAVGKRGDLPRKKAWVHWIQGLASLPEGGLS